MYTILEQVMVRMYVSGPIMPIAVRDGSLRPAKKKLDMSEQSVLQCREHENKVQRQGRCWHLARQTVIFL